MAGKHNYTDMIKENNNFDWVYYILGLFGFGFAGAVITGSFGYTILFAIIGFIVAAIFLKSIVKGRVH